MGRLARWIGGALGGVTAYRLLRRRPLAVPEPAPESPQPDERAGELRAKLAESRAAEPAPVVEEQPAAAPVAEEGPVDPDPEESPDERRRRVHEEGRSALDEMKPE